MKKQDYLVQCQDGDGQPLTSWDAFGMDEVREVIAIAREDWAHYPQLRFLVTNEAGVVVIDRTYQSKVKDQSRVEVEPPDDYAERAAERADLAKQSSDQNLRDAGRGHLVRP